MVIEISQHHFDSAVINSEKPVLVDFFATWCGPCKMMSPVLEQISQEVEGKASVYKIDVDQNPELASQYGIMSVPTLIVFKGGKAEKTFVGMQSKQALVDALM